MKRMAIIILLITVFFLVGCSRFKTLSNNTATYPDGKVARAFSFYVKDFQNDNLTWSEIEKFSSEQYTSDVDTLYIYYFDEEMVGSTIRGLKLKRSYRKKCIAIFKQIPGNKSRLIQFPFEESRLNQ